LGYKTSGGGKAMSGKQWFILLVVFQVTCLLLVSYSAAAPAKKVNVAVPQEPTSIDPSLPSGGPDFVVIENWGEYPIFLARNGDLKPGLFTSWKVSADGKLIEFVLRKGVKFHSGDLLTAKDVAFSYERGRTKNPTVKSRLVPMERFEIIDDYRFKIHFRTPDVTFIPNRGHVAIVSKNYYDRVGEDKFVKEPVGTGPYKVVSYLPGQYLDLERFEDYWGDKPSVKEARVFFVPEDTTRVAKVKTGEVDLINGCPYPMVKEIEKTVGFKVIRFENYHPTASVSFATRNSSVPWHDRRVRLAMAYAIDSDAIIKNVLHGIPNRFALIAPHELGYDPNVKPYPYDPKKARELLAEAGYPKGFEFKLYYALTGRLPMVREIAEAIASYFEAVGIRTKLVAEEYARLISRRRAAKTPDADLVFFLSISLAGGPDPTYFLTQTLSGDGGLSIYYNPEFDKVVAEARATVNDTKRAELIRKAVNIIHDEAPVIPIFMTTTVFVTRETIDFTPTKNYVDLMLIRDITLK
jgi:peptide/nickel transport system substrate-binding protein